MPRESFVDLVGKVLTATKNLAGIGLPQQWHPNRDPNELSIKIPLEIDGLQVGHKLIAVFEPASHTLKFSILITVNEVCITRLDFDKTGGHTNSLLALQYNIPPIVSGNHFHRWALNKRFVTACGNLERLENAEAIPDSIRTFDAALRWFCDECNIQLPHNHAIELPPRRLI